MVEAIKSLLPDEVNACDLAPFASEHLRQHIDKHPEYGIHHFAGFNVIREKSGDFVGRYLISTYDGYDVTDENHNVIFSDEVIIPLFVDATDIIPLIERSSAAVKNEFKYKLPDGRRFGNIVTSSFYLNTFGCKEPLYMVGNEESFGVVDHNGKEIIPKKYHSFSVLPITRFNNKFSGDSLIIATYKDDFKYLFDVYDCKGNLLYERLYEIQPLEETINYKFDFNERDMLPVSKKLKKITITVYDDLSDSTDDFTVDTESLYFSEEHGIPFPKVSGDFSRGDSVLTETTFLSDLKGLFKRWAESYEGEHPFTEKEFILRIPIWEKIANVTKPIDDFSYQLPVKGIFEISMRLQRFLRLRRVKTISDVCAFDIDMEEDTALLNKALREEFKLLQERINYNIRLQNKNSD